MKSNRVAYARQNDICSERVKCYMQSPLSMSFLFLREVVTLSGTKEVSLRPFGKFRLIGKFN